MVIQINVDSEVPVYRQIVDALRPKLVEGELTAGDLLPPVRQLAADLGVHFNTVAEAYRILAEEGWLDLRRRRGAIVLERKTPRADREAVNIFARRLREYIAEVQAVGIPAAAIVRELRQLAESLEQ
jgi:DNA-binding transcriptional regulator YhcF (GntR family)